MNADHEEAVEFAKISKRENRVYVGNLSYDVKYRDLIEFMRGGGFGRIIRFLCSFVDKGVVRGEVFLAVCLPHERGWDRWWRDAMPMLLS